MRKRWDWMSWSMTVQKAKSTTVKKKTDFEVGSVGYEALLRILKGRGWQRSGSWSAWGRKQDFTGILSGLPFLFGKGFCQEVCLGVAQQPFAKEPVWSCPDWAWVRSWLAPGLQEMRVRQYRNEAPAAHYYCEVSCCVWTRPGSVGRLQQGVKTLVGSGSAGLSCLAEPVIVGCYVAPRLMFLLAFGQSSQKQSSRVWPEL